MESGGIVRTVIITALFLVLVCDYTTLIAEIYRSAVSGNGTRTIIVEDDGKSAVDVIPGFVDVPDFDLDTSLDLDNHNLFGGMSKSEVASIVKNICLPKLICELTSNANNKRLKPNEISLLKLISETTLGTYAEVPSVYHFAAHMGQLIAGSDVGCHVFYSSCPLPGKEVLKMLKDLKNR